MHQIPTPPPPAKSYLAPFAINKRSVVRNFETALISCSETNSHLMGLTTTGVSVMSMLVPKWWFFYGPSTFIELPFYWKKAFALLMYVCFIDAVKYRKEPFCRKGLILFWQITCKHPLDLMPVLWEIWHKNLNTWILLAQNPFHFLVHVWLAHSSFQWMPALETFAWLRKGMPDARRGRGFWDWIPYSGLSFSVSGSVCGYW